MILMAILAPMAAMVVQMAISRSREYEADKGGAEICGQPLALAKIAGEAHRMPNYEAGGHPATAHMFIINPLSGARMDNLFSTHPATENRIAALQELAQQMGRGGFGRGPQVATGGPMPRGPWGPRKRGP